MAIDDPKTRTLTKAETASDDPADDFEEPTLAAQVAALTAQLEAVKAQMQGGLSMGLSEARLEQMFVRVAQISADAQERAANPSNKTHPAISVFSYPEGDRARRRPDFKCPMFQLGAPMDWDTTSAEEVELVNMAEPGVYAFKRTNGQPEKLTIEGERDAGGAITRLLFIFPTKEHRDTLPRFDDMLRSAFHVKTPEQLELEALRAEVAKLREGVPA